MEHGAGPAFVPRPVDQARWSTRFTQLGPTMMTADFALEVRSALYRHIAATAAIPTLAEMAQQLGATRNAIRDAYGHLYRSRTLVLEDDGETIRMAPPFSGVPTQHVVLANGREYFANCSWDALGIPAALHTDADVRSRCEQSGEALHLRVRDANVEPAACTIHFAVPAAHWWDDIVYT